MHRHQGKKLDGWKAIADHIGRDIRTAQRWARQRGMPVHHVPGGPSGSVFADPDDIDDWLGSGSAFTERHSPVAGFPESARHLPIDPPGPTAVAVRARARGRLLLVASAVGALTLAGIAWWQWTRPDPALDRVELMASSLVGFNGRTVAWRFPLPLADSHPLDAAWRTSDLRVLNLGQNGEGAVLANLHLARPSDPYARCLVLLLSSRGQPFWSYSPEATLRFGSRQFGGVWRCEGTVAADGPGGPETWVAVAHHTWWPSYLVSIDQTGRHVLRFVNPGRIAALATIDNDSGSYLIAAGVNNEQAAAMLAVIDRGAVSSSAPTTTYEYTCRDCPVDRPYSYIVFPQSEVSRNAGEAYAEVREVAVNDDGVEVFVGDAGDPLSFQAVYTLKRDFTPLGVGTSHAYQAAHRRFEREGRLDHALSSCPERTQGLPVRVWRRSTGWREVRVRPAFVTGDGS